jgi:hypothetical protein
MGIWLKGFNTIYFIIFGFFMIDPSKKPSSLIQYEAYSLLPLRPAQTQR